MNDAIEQLKQLGFSQYEAQAYVSLLQSNPLNGYELAKASGIPRPNIYSVLQKLEERGAVLRIDSDEGTRYTPVASEELIQRLHNQFELSLESAKQSLEQLTPCSETEYIWNVRGYAALLDRARDFIDITEKQLMLAVWPQEAKILAENISRAEERGVEITTLCLAGCARECGYCRGSIHRHAVAAGQAERWLVLVPDQAQVLAGEIKSQDEALTALTRQKLLVNLATWYISHSIALAVLLKDLDGQLAELLTPETQSILAELGAGNKPGGWLGHMRDLLAN